MRFFCQRIDSFEGMEYNVDRILFIDSKENSVLIDIFGTLGPACDNEGTLAEMLRSGMTGVRLNLSHITLESASEQISRLQNASAGAGASHRIAS